MLIHDPFSFGFSYGAGFLLSITGLGLSVLSMTLFEKSKIQKYVSTIDMVLLLASLVARCVPKSQAFWVIMPLLTATYVILFSMYPFLRLYDLLGFKTKVVGFIGYVLTYVACIVYGLSARGFLSSMIGFWVYLSIMPFMFIYSFMLLFKIIIMIKNNPMKKENGRQTRLLVISNYTIVGAFSFAGPCSVLAIMGAYFQNGVLLDSSVGFIALTGFVSTGSSFLMTMNKHIKHNKPHKLVGIEVYSERRVTKKLESPLEIPELENLENTSSKISKLKTTSSM